MGWLDKLLGKDVPVTTVAAPEAERAAVKPFEGLDGIRFGRYSDNNKPYAKIRAWYVAEDRFKEKAYPEAFTALFEHLSDEDEKNVAFRSEGQAFSFEFIQGSKKIRGRIDAGHIVAIAEVAIMRNPSNPVMHRLLDLNYTLCYTRFALDDKQTLCQIFDTPVDKATPNKLYYGLRELAKYADREDDLMMSEFSNLTGVDSELVQPLPQTELEVKYNYFRTWITETLERVEGLNADSFAGAISYSFLTLLYRIDFLLVPEAALMAKLEVLSNTYWTKKEEIPLIHRNASMKEGIRKLLDITKEEFSKGVYRTKGTFAVVATPPPDKIRENVLGALRDAEWYVENKYPDLVLVIYEYGMVYNQFSYSMPRVITELATIYLAVLHADFFKDLGMTPAFINMATGQLDPALITLAVDEVMKKWADKYTNLKWEHGRISYSSISDFARSFPEQVAALNLEIRR